MGVGRIPATVPFPNVYAKPDALIGIVLPFESVIAIP